MKLLAAATGILLLLVVLGDTFETIVLPRGVTRRFRLARVFYRYTWAVWRWITGRLPVGRRESFLGFYGPLSLLNLLGVWAVCLVFAFALVYWSMGSPVTAPEPLPGFGTDLYVSGTTFFTLGLGDVTPHGTLARILMVAQAGFGLGFLAIVIGYLPVLYQSFSRREVSISLLDARGGSPPTAAELLRRHALADDLESLISVLRDAELWLSDLLESHLSFPVLTYYRSQHDRQSWLGAVTAILDTCALVQVGIDGIPTWQAQLTFAMARHAIVDISLVTIAKPYRTVPDRLPPEELERLRTLFSDAGLRLRGGEEAETRLAELRRMYEPYLFSLSERLLFPLPPFILTQEMDDAWETTAWARTGHL